MPVLPYRGGRSRTESAALIPEPVVERVEASGGLYPFRAASYLGARPLSSHLSNEDAVLVRLVHMTFRPDRVDDFLNVFDDSAPRIRAFPGCLHLELLQDHEYSNLFSTLSHWKDDDALEHYRTSNLFRGTWARTKSMFAAPPDARSYRILRHHP